MTSLHLRTCIVAGLLAVLQARPAPGQTMNIARSLERSGQLDAAWAEYARMVERDGRDSTAYAGFARLSHAVGRDDSLVAVSIRLRELWPNEPSFALGLLGGLLGMKNRSQALAEARRIARHWPGRLLSLASELERVGEYAAALGYLKQSGADSDRVLAPRLIDLYEKTGQFAAAARTLVGMVNLRSSALPAYVVRLASYAKQVDPNQLLAELDALHRPADRARAKAAVLVAAQREGEAVRLLATAVSPQELYLYGRECEDAGELRAALAVYAAESAVADQARVLRLMGRYDDALAALAHDTGSGTTFELAELYRRQGRRFREAVTTYRRALTSRPGDEGVLYGLASSYVGLALLDSARRTLAQVARPTDRVLLLWAQLMLFEGKVDSCRDYATQMTRQFPTSVLLNDALELSALSLAGDRAAALGSALLDFETGDGGTCRRRAGALTRGGDIVAGHAWLLLARQSRRQGRPKEALAMLDSAAAQAGAEQLRGRVLLQQAAVLRDDLGDSLAYRRKLEEVVLTLPATPYAPVARGMLMRRDEPSGASDLR